MWKWASPRHKIISVANPGCLYRIPDPNFSIPDPESTVKKIPDPDPHQRIKVRCFKPKSVSKLSENHLKWSPRIRFSPHPGFPIQGSKSTVNRLSNTENNFGKIHVCRCLELFLATFFPIKSTHKKFSIPYNKIHGESVKGVLRNKNEFLLNWNDKNVPFTHLLTDEFH